MMKGCKLLFSYGNLKNCLIMHGVQGNCMQSTAEPAAKPQRQRPDHLAEYTFQPALNPRSLQLASVRTLDVLLWHVPALSQNRLCHLLHARVQGLNKALNCCQPWQSRRSGSRCTCLTMLMLEHATRHPSRMLCELCYMQDLGGYSAATHHRFGCGSAGCWCTHVADTTWCLAQGRSIAELADISASTQARAECCQRWDNYKLQVCTHRAKQNSLKAVDIWSLGALLPP